MEERRNADSHRITFSNRETGTVTGTKDVISFDEKEILLLTDFGKLIVRGEQLHVSRLDLERGEVDLTGKIDSLQYVQKGAAQKKDSLMKRMFQ